MNAIQALVEERNALVDKLNESGQVTLEAIAKGEVDPMQVAMQILASSQAHQRAIHEIDLKLARLEADA